MDGKFEFHEIGRTEEASKAFLRQIDKQIDEVSENLTRLQEARRTVATMIGASRRTEAGPIGRMLDAADRSHFEGEGMRLVPREAGNKTGVSS